MDHQAKDAPHHGGRRGLATAIGAALLVASCAGQTGTDAAAQADARNAVTELEVCFVDAQTYKGCELSKALPVGEGLGQVRIAERGAATYEIAARSESGLLFSVIKGPDGSVARECAPAALRDCTAAGTW